MKILLSLILLLSFGRESLASEKLFFVDKQRAFIIAKSKIEASYGKGVLDDSYSTIIRHQFSSNNLKQDFLYVKFKVVRNSKTLIDGTVVEELDTYSLALDENGKLLAKPKKGTSKSTSYSSIKSSKNKN